MADGKVYVTDRVIKPESVERVHCFDAKTGKNLWTHTYPRDYRKVGYPIGPRAAVTIDTGRAYSLGATGYLHCLDAAAGDVIWKKDLRAEYNIRMPIWGIASAPLVEGDGGDLLRRPAGNRAKHDIQPLRHETVNVAEPPGVDLAFDVGSDRQVVEQARGPEPNVRAVGRVVVLG